MEATKLRDGTWYPGHGAEAAPSRFWDALTPFNPGANTAGEPLAVFANEGRWIASCPCGGAQLASPTDHRFMCVNCANVSNGGNWRPLQWPPNRAAIEAALAGRDPVNQNWLPGETVADLLAENKTKGVSR